jgi:parvulin-like peptidyl-prolyl isomerase
VRVNRRSLVAILAVAIAATAGLVAGCGSGLPGNAVAKVGQVYIEKAAFTQQLDSYTSQNGITMESNPADYKAAAVGVLENLIQNQLAAQKAPALGVAVTDDDVQAEIDSTVSYSFDGDLAAFVSRLAEDSVTLDDYRKLLKGSDSFLTQKVREQVTKDVAPPTDEQVEAYYEDNKASFLTKKAYDARHILLTVDARLMRESTTTTAAADSTTTSGSTTTSEATATTAQSTTTSGSTTTTGFSDLAWSKALVTAAEVRLDLLAGGSWSRLAKLYSDDSATKDSGGELGSISQGDLAAAFGQEFENALLALQLDQISEPVKTENGYHIIQVTRITESRQQTLDEAKASIVASLFDDAKWAAWMQWVEDAKLELGVTYRDDLRPTTTQAPTTTAKP